MKKRIIVTTIIILFACLALNIVYAASTNRGYTVGLNGANSLKLPRTSGVTPGNDDGKPSKNKENQNGNHRYLCYYESTVRSGIDVNVKTYDMNGNPIIDDESGKIGKVFSSGTWAGLFVTETKSSIFNVESKDFLYIEERKKYTCTYTCKNCGGGGCKGNYVNGQCTGGYYPKHDTTETTTKTVDYYASKPTSSDFGKTCNSIDDGVVVEENRTSVVYPTCFSEVVEDARNDAVGRVKNPGTTVQYINMNAQVDDTLAKKARENNQDKEQDLYPENQNSIDNYLAQMPTEKEYEPDPDKTVLFNISNIHVSESYKQIFYHRPKYVCLNLKTGKVRYNIKCDSDEMDVTWDQP